MATAKKAKGLVRIDGDAGAEIPRGTELAREDDVRFQTAKKAKVPEGADAVDVAVSALTGGEEGKTAAGEKLALVAALDGFAEEAVVLEGGLGFDAPAKKDEAPAAETAEEGERVLVNYVTGGPVYHEDQPGTLLSLNAETGVAEVEVFRRGAKPIQLTAYRRDGPAFPGPTWSPAPAAE